ncbi:WD repeat protein, partial [Ichthyophthirius multifiliis]
NVQKNIQKQSQQIQKKDYKPEYILNFERTKKSITSIDFHPNNSQIVFSCKDSHIQIQDLNETNNLPLTFPKFNLHKGITYCVKYNQKGNILATSGQDRKINIYTNDNNGQENQYQDYHIIKAHSGGVRSIEFSFNDEFLLSASDDRTLKLWHGNTRKYLTSFLGHNNVVRMGVFSPDARLIGSCSDDRSIKIWDLQNQKCIYSINSHSDVVKQSFFSPDGTSVVSCSFDKSIKIHDLRSRKVIQNYQGAHSEQINCLQVHPSGLFLSSGGSDGKVKIWDMRMCKQTFTVYTSDEEIYALNYNQDGSCFATGGSEKTVILWKNEFFEESEQNMIPQQKGFLQKKKKGSSDKLDDKDQQQFKDELDNIEENENVITQALQASLEYVMAKIDCLQQEFKYSQ